MNIFKHHLKEIKNLILINKKILKLENIDNLGNVSLEIPPEQFNFDWKNFFVENKELKSKSISYFYKNLITEKDPFSWATKTIWFGRFKQKYKFRPENLQEKQILNITKIDHSSA